MFQKLQFPLLCPRVRRPRNDLVLLLHLVQLHLQFDNLLASILQVLDQTLLDDLKLRKLDLVRFAIPLKLLGGVRKVLVVCSCRGSSESALSSVRKRLLPEVTYVQLFIGQLVTLYSALQATDLSGSALSQLVESVDLCAQ